MTKPMAEQAADRDRGSGRTEGAEQTETAEPLVVTQRVGADPETVFDFLADPDKMLRWMGTEVDIDPVPGGRFWLNATGTDIAIGKYVEVDRPNRLVFTWGWKGSDAVPPGSTTVTIILTAEPDGDDNHNRGGTTVELHHVGLPIGQDVEHNKGWTYYLDRLAAVSEGRDPNREANRESH